MSTTKPTRRRCTKYRWIIALTAIYVTILLLLTNYFTRKDAVGRAGSNNNRNNQMMDMRKKIEKAIIANPPIVIQQPLPPTETSPAKPKNSRDELLHSDPTTVYFVDEKRFHKSMVSKVFSRLEKSDVFDDVTLEFSKLRDVINSAPPINTRTRSSDGVIPLPHPEFRMTVNVITFNRPKSLNRLCESLLNTEYYGHEVFINFFVDQGADDLTVEYVKNFVWRHGKKKIFLRHEKSGLVRAILESWYPAHAHDYVMLAEDDIEVSPYWYRWVLENMRIYRYPSVPEVPLDSDIVGISLYTPRECEMAMPRFMFYPDKEYSSPSYLHQVPCSWGAVYFPEHWMYYRLFVDARNYLGKNIFIPDCECNGWRGSWVKFYTELMFLKGWSMVYPNFVNQTSFSTNHVEPGVHVKAGDSHSKDKFTVPLATTNVLPDVLPSVDAIPLVDYKCKIYKSHKEAKELGKSTWDKFLIEVRRKEKATRVKLH